MRSTVRRSLLFFSVFLIGVIGSAAVGSQNPQLFCEGDAIVNFALAAPYAVGELTDAEFAETIVINEIQRREGVERGAALHSGTVFEDRGDGIVEVTRNGNHVAVFEVHTDRLRNERSIGAEVYCLDSDGKSPGGEHMTHLANSFFETGEDEPGDVVGKVTDEEVLRENS